MPDTPETTRLNKFLAFELGLSRRQADDLIADGHIKIDDRVATLGARIAPHETVYRDGQAIHPAASPRLVMFHKPVGYVCSRRAQGETPTIYSLLPDDMATLKPVGRLDKDSSGLILLTNDGDLAFHMTHPKFYKTKIYEVALNAPLQPLHRQMISDFGVILPDGKSKFELERLDDETNSTDTRWRITMHEGRNRQIRRTFEALGYTVTALHRTRFGSYDLDTLESGAHCDVAHTS